MRWLVVFFALWCGTAVAQPIVGPCMQQALGGCALSGPLTLPFAGTALTLPAGSNASIGGTLTVTGSGGSNALFVPSPASAATEGLILTAPIAASAPFKFSTVNGGGFDFAGQMEIARAFTYSGTTSFAQQGLFVDLIPSGTSADASRVGIE